MPGTREKDKIYVVVVVVVFRPHLWMWIHVSALKTTRFLSLNLN